MANLDWSEGDYERTAETLNDASLAAVAAAHAASGSRVLDLGCGTGNAAIEAARRGADVLAIDPAARLVEVCRARAARLGVVVTAEVGDASAIPAPDASFDAIVSVFAVIFAPLPERAVEEMLRVSKPGARIVLTSWSPHGAISRVSASFRKAMAVLDPPAAKRAAPAWGDPAFVKALFERRGVEASIEERTLSFSATSPEAWFEEQEAHHPVWRGIKRALAAHPAEWDRVRAESIAVLHEGNEDASCFRTTSTYLLISVLR
jgi:ubiquinone/menaquinone biosynthesis C-methylase UbiE